MKNQIIVTSLFAIFTASSFSVANAKQHRKGPPKGKPPAEVFTACADLAEADSCSFSGNHGEVSGTCKAPPQGREGPLACVPEGGRPKQ